MTVLPLKVFVAARGNRFMTEIAEWLVEAANELGPTATLISDSLPAMDGSINLVVAPHEFFELFDAPRAELQNAAAVSVCLNTEQPGTQWFRLALDVCRRGLFTLDMSDQGVEALRSAGVAVERLRLGAVPSLAVSGEAERPIDVSFMGGLDDRRGAVLAELAAHLWDKNTDIRLMAVDRPIDATTPDAVFGAEKQAVLASAKVLLNIHRGRLEDGHAPYFEWARAIEAMAAGCVLVSEPSSGYEPLVPGQHFVECTAADMPSVVEKLLHDESQREAIVNAARHVVFKDLRLSTALAPVLQHIEDSVLPQLKAHARDRSICTAPWRLGATRGPHPVRLGPFRPYLPVLSRAKQIAMAENAAQGRLDAAECLLRHGTPQHIVRAETPAYDDARPEVSVVVSLYNYASVVTETLDSIVASAGVDFEVVVVEDHATDHSRLVVEEFIEGHPTVPIVLIAKDANEGLAAARNTGFEASRASLVMVMDADNMIYPTCLRKLADALHGEPDAAAAYAILEDFGEQRNVRSAIAWDPRRLCRANYIDAQAMFRKSTWSDLGGYRADDEHVYGWEDWDLWLRLAQSGGRAVLVRQILGRYRVQRGSMISLTNLATDDAIAAMRRRHPSLPWPASTEAL